MKSIFFSVNKKDFNLNKYIYCCLNRITNGRLNAQLSQPPKTRK